MILRKPYAFIIKHFKLLHLILTGLVGISIYRLTVISSFLNEYLSSPVIFNRYSAESYLSSSASDMISKSNSLFPFYTFLLPLITVLITIVILFILYNKKKPYLLYIFVIIYSIALLAFYGISYNLISDMQTNLVDTRFTNLIKDLTTIVTFIGIGITLFLLIRATGFDIKKFNFVKDIQDLDISEEDSEEFEVELNIDSNVLRRRIRKILRNIKYFYIEKKFMINLFLVFLVVISGFIVYFVIIVHHKVYEQSSYFGSDDFTMHIDNVYLTNKDYLGNQITDKYLVIIDLNVRSSYTNGKKLDISDCILTIGKNEYKHISKYRDYIYDIGTVYENDLIYTRTEKNMKRTDYKSNYLLVYEIPSSLINEKMTFRYTMDFDVFANTLRPKYAKVKLNPINLDKNSSINSYEVNEQIVAKDSIMKDLTLTISSYEINNPIPQYYRFCLNTSSCFDSVEYITPSIGNIDKTVLKVTGNIENINITGINNLYNFINKFGKIEYKLSGTIKSSSIINKITSKHVSNDTYYFEIPKEVEKASSISLKFYLRNKIYEYILKEEIN